MQKLRNLKDRKGTYYSNFSRNGKRVVVKLHRDAKIAQQMVDDMVAMRDATSGGAAPADVTLEAVLDRVMQHHKAEGSLTTLVFYERAFRKLKEAEPVQKLAQLTPELLGRVKGRWREDGVGSAEINKRLRCIKAAMRLCEDWGWSPRAQNWRGVKTIPDGDGQRDRVHSGEELRAIRNASTGQLRSMFYLCYMAGMRPGEAFWLPWENVRFDDGKDGCGQIVVAHTVVDPATEEAWHPKMYFKVGKRAERRIDMWPELKDYLLRLKTAKSGHWVVANQDGKRYKSKESLWQQWPDVLLKAEVVWGSLYVLRHTFNTEMQERGCAVEYRMSQMGHALPGTNSIYSHSAPPPDIEKLRMPSKMSAVASGVAALMPAYPAGMGTAARMEA